MRMLTEPARLALTPGRLPPAVPADVSEALSALGIDHTIRGDEASALCPHPDHDDRHPSWSCNLQTGLHNCLACGWYGSFTRLVALVRGTRHDEAAAWISARRTRRSPVEGDLGREPRPQAPASEADLWETTDPPGHALAGRGISLESARALEIRWHPRRQSWVFPIRDNNDRLLGWQEKSGHTFRNKPRDVRKNGSVFGLRNLRATGTTGPAVVVESPLDAARFWTAGFRRAVAVYGIGFSDRQIDFLWPWCDELIFAQDNDIPGQRRIARWIADHRINSGKIRVFDYGACFEDYLHRYVHPEGDGRDPGDLSDRELRRGTEWATPAWRTYFEGVTWWG